MANRIYKAENVEIDEQSQLIEVPEIKREDEDEFDLSFLQFSGPNPEEVQIKIDFMRRDFEAECRERADEFNEQIATLRNEYENLAFNKVKEASEIYDEKIQEANYESQKILDNAKIQAEKIVEEAIENSTGYEETAHKRGFESGREEGFTKGSDEVKELISRLNNVLSEAVKKRNEIPMETEDRLLQVIIINARDLVKRVTEESERVVLDNIFDVLKSIKGRQEVSLRINTLDLPTVVHHKKEFLQLSEGIEQLRIIEDNSVDKGGCIVQTDFGTIDTRISTLLTKLEKEIIKTMKK